MVSGYEDKQSILVWACLNLGWVLSRYSRIYLLLVLFYSCSSIDILMQSVTAFGWVYGVWTVFVSIELWGSQSTMTGFQSCYID